MFKKLMIVFLLVVSIFGLSELTSAEENLALNKPVIYEHVPEAFNWRNPVEHLVDGDEETLWHTYSHAEKATIIVDLKDVYRIDEVLLVDSPDHVRTFDYIIETSLCGTNWKQVFEETEDTRQKMLNQIEAVGRYVKISFKVNKGGFELARLGIFGEPASEEDTITNFALKKNLSSNITDVEGNEIEKESGTNAVDGNYETSWQSAPDSSPDSGWLEVDLGSEQSFRGIKLIQGEKREELTYDFEYSTDGDSWEKLVEETSDFSYYIDHYLTESVSAQYIRLNINDVGDRNENMISLKALEIWGEK